MGLSSYRANDTSYQLRHKMLEDTYNLQTQISAELENTVNLDEQWAAAVQATIAQKQKEFLNGLKQSTRLRS